MLAIILGFVESKVKVPTYVLVAISMYELMAFILDGEIGPKFLVGLSSFNQWCMLECGYLVQVYSINMGLHNKGGFSIGRVLKYAHADGMMRMANELVLSHSLCNLYRM